MRRVYVDQEKSSFDAVESNHLYAERTLILCLNEPLVMAVTRDIRLDKVVVLGHSRDRRALDV